MFYEGTVKGKEYFLAASEYSHFARKHAHYDHTSSAPEVVGKEILVNYYPGISGRLALHRYDPNFNNNAVRQVILISGLGYMLPFLLCMYYLFKFISGRNNPAELKTKRQATKTRSGGRTIRVKRSKK